MSTTLAKGLKLLEALCLAREPVGITELARNIDMNLSAAQRLLGTFVTLGYAEQQAKSRKYRATLATWELGAQVLREHPYRRAIHPILRHAAHGTGNTAYFILNQAPFVTYFDKVEGQNGATFSSELGTSVPIGMTAAGKAIIAFLEDDELQKLRHPASKGPVDYKVLDLGDLAPQIDEVRRNRFASSTSGFRKGVNSVSAPVWDASGRVCGAIALTADEHALPAEAFLDAGLKVVRFAEEASLGLGGTPYPQRFYQPG